MPKMHINKSISVDVPVDKAFASIRDFRQWTIWSPWIIAEPDCAITYSEDGMQYAWDGMIIGSGSMEILEEVPNEVIRYKLSFLKPWKSVSDVSFEFLPKSGGVDISWTMDGSLPWFMGFMKKMMTAAVGMDYERGLNMLKDYLEGGKVLSKLCFPGIAAFGGLQYVGVRRTCQLGDIGDVMPEDFGKLVGWMQQEGIEPTQQPFAIYHDFNLTEGTTDFTSGIPLDNLPASVPEGFTTGTIPACQAYRIEHAGPYRHLGNAWSSGLMHSRAKVFKQNKSIPPFEIYVDDPENTSEEALRTVIHFPAK